MKRTCPECQRELETRVNRLGVEMWPTHNFASLNKANAEEYNRILHENRDREVGRRDWEVRCNLSSTPVEL